MANMKLHLKLPPEKTGFGQHCNGHTQASAQAAAAFVRMYCIAMINGRQYACDACSYSAGIDAAPSR
jgi:hypothetical protein